MRFVVNEFKFEIEMTFRVPTLATVAVMFETTSRVETFRVPTLA